ncbi:LOW QUALITY PROTEIN: ral guanine nucleotide dissociation stimulator-like 2 [Pungitius pungitius]|uniref:LOW QUALITY PROTEIN: ral guanine nucleotide dissociation stimulator-like 2 n=1 Tax=Pungitius pungitius TaxID=134920 RepID=UPI002E0FC94C
MLPRNMRTGGCDLPGVESTDVPLIGYRPLQPDSEGNRSQSRRGSGVDEWEASQAEPSPMKTTWYCPLELSTVVEEQDDGVIYTVVVKQQHGAPTSPASASRSQCVKAGTEEKLVLHLLHSFSTGDSSFITIFLSTYRSFTSTGRVLDILTDRLENPPGGDERSRMRQSFNRAVCTVFSTWLSEYPEDFESLEEPSRLLRLAPLLPRDSSSAAELSARVLAIAEALSEKGPLREARKDPSGLAGPPPDASRFEPTSVLGFPAATIAEQLTKIETELFVRLVPYHCLGSLWSQRDKKGREGVCWSVRATIRQFNKLANAVLEFEVLAQIRLLQSSCKNCVFTADEAFARWYQSVPSLTEAESYRLSNEIEAPGEPSPRGLPPSVVITQCPDLSTSRSSLTGDSDSLFDFPSPVNNLLSKLTKHMKSPSVSCLDVDTSPSSTNESTPAALTPSAPAKSHRRSVSCGNNPPNNIQGSGPDMRIIRIRMDLQDGNLYRSILVTSNDKSPTVISSALEKHNQDPKQTSRYELIQLLPEAKELAIPATGNVFYAMSSSSVDFLLRRKGGSAPPGSQPISTETSATFPRIKAKGRRLVRTLF